MAAQGSGTSGVTKPDSSFRTPIKSMSDVVLKLSIRSQDVFPFEKLPPEIRNQIHRLSLLTDGPIAVSRHVDITKQASGLSTCAHGFYHLCTSCKKPEEHLLRASTIVLQGKQKRKAPMQTAYTGALVRTNHQFCEEAADILYGQNQFIFATPSAFDQFCDRIHRFTSSLKDVTIKDVHLPAHTDILKVLAENCKLNLKIKGSSSRTLYVDAPSLLRMIRPLITKPGTVGCVCGARPSGSCSCRTAEQLRVFKAINFSDFNWAKDGPNDVERKDIVEQAWLAWAKSSKSKQKAQKERRLLEAKSFQV
ncbi:hypothetical protein LTR56_000667 [Elasticomyces elasticus]|nr:hypothetical protein LTR56_000667 [Elasticomyces elasticus]KAK3664444.1 hypothetical protein LTR22_004857 [Elasticomyces elasticus]KAK4919447.1 hypothetical protein LTR49_012981 [Elasticomyces elasticus]KAK5758320.1 hypothetical protein LTS12_011643 [Elasticomyces elasticus]